MEHERIKELMGRMLAGDLNDREKEELRLLLSVEKNLAGRLRDQTALDALLRSCSGRLGDGPEWSGVLRRVGRQRDAGLVSGLRRVLGAEPQRRLATLATAASLIIALYWFLGGRVAFKEAVAENGRGVAAKSAFEDVGVCEKNTEAFPVVSDVSGYLAIGERARDAVPLRRGMELAPGTLLVAGEDGGRLRLSLRGREVGVALDIGSAVLVGDADGGRFDLELKRGEMELGPSPVVLRVVTAAGRVTADKGNCWIRLIEDFEKKALGLQAVRGGVLLVLATGDEVQITNDSGSYLVLKGEVAWSTAGQSPVALRADDEAAD